MGKGSLQPIHFEALRRDLRREVFKVLAHPTRIHIIETLRGGERSVGEILAQVEKVEPAKVCPSIYRS